MNAGKTPPLLLCLAVIAIGALVYAGTMLIRSSNKIYEQSYQQSEKLIAKALDPSFSKAPMIIPPGYSIIKDGYTQATSIFLVALGICLFLFLFPRLQNFSIGPGGINLTLKDLQQNVELLMKQANVVQAETTGEGGLKAKDAAFSKESKMIRTRDVDEDDPQKGKWGRRAVNNFRKISAEVENTQWDRFYSVRITVESTNAKFPLRGLVRFHLHDTFKNADPVIIARDNKAVLKLSKVYGAFTVGAEADDGETKLELDLATIEGAPKGFLEH
jgi:hypothetical protein